MNKKTLLLDVNNTFMFDEDKFGDNDNFSIHYKEIGGKFPADKVRSIILSAYNYLNALYPDEKYKQNFPSVKTAILNTFGDTLSANEMKCILETFAFHELGIIPKEYINVLFKLKEHFILSVVIDIWSDKKMWLETFNKTGLNALFSASSFSSDHGMVKPSPKPFELVANNLDLKPGECLVIGDSIRRDLGGAIAAGIDCILVGGATDNRAIHSYTSLLEFYNTLEAVD